MFFISKVQLQYSTFSNVVTLIRHQSLEIFFYFSTALEMIHTYVNECQDQPTVEGFWSWNLNNTYHLVCQLVFNFALAIINHPIYQEIEYRDLRQKTVMPSEVLEQCNKNLTYMIVWERREASAQWFHIRRKSSMPKNVGIERSDTEIMWWNVSRSLDDIINITKSVNDKLHIHELDGERVASISFEVLWWTVLLWHTNYLVKSAGRDLAYNMYDEPLHPDIINISEKAKGKRIWYLNLWWKNSVVLRGEIEFLRVSDFKRDGL